MKNIKKIIFSILILSVVFALCACEAFSDALEKALEEAIEEDYEYSDNGITETNMVFDSISGDDFRGSLFYKFHIVEGEETVDFDVKTYGDEIDGVKKTKFEYTIDNKTYDMLKVGEQLYYYNQTDKIIYSSINDLPSIMTIGFALGKYSKVKFVDDEITKWEFNSKQEATVKDLQGEDIATVEFSYNSTENNNTVDINFNKKLLKIERMYFVVYDGDSEDIFKEVNSYLYEINTSNPDGTFDIPTVQNGYVEE